MECYNCGRRGHIARDQSCPAKGKKCRTCGKVIHFHQKCRSTAAKGKVAGGKKPAKKKGKPRSNTNALAADENSAAEPEEDGFVFNVTTDKQLRSGIVSLIVGRVGLHYVMIDSGAASNIIAAVTWERLKKKGVKVLAQQKHARELLAYGSKTPLQTKGAFTAEVVSPVNGKRCTADIVVVEGEGRSLLGKSTAEQLGLLRVGPDTCTISNGGEDV